MYTVIVAAIDWENKEYIPAVYTVAAESKVEAMTKAKSKLEAQWGSMLALDAEMKIIAMFEGAITNNPA